MADDIKQIAKKLSREEYLVLGPEEFRAFFRQRIHVLVEKNLYWAITKGRKPGPAGIEIAKELVSIWRERKLPVNAPDYKWALQAIEIAENWARGIKPDLSRFAPYRLSPGEVKAFDKVIKERRSIRAWKGKRVSGKTIDLLLTAGTWAAVSCNQQAVRFIVVREENAPGLIPVNTPDSAPIHILILEDERNYNANAIMPVRNRLLDAGAVVQNIILTAHAHGLGSVWLTHNDQDLKKIRNHFKLADYISIITLVDVGYPAYTPPPNTRMGLDDYVFKRV
jgi:nitroreductase